jgi:hypothetical protein
MCTEARCRAVWPRRLSHFGGLDFTIAGFGFEPLSGPLTQLGRDMAVLSPDGHLPANLTTGLPLQLTAATSTLLSLRVPRLMPAPGFVSSVVGAMHWRRLRVAWSDSGTQAQWVRRVNASCRTIRAAAQLSNE